MLISIALGGVSAWALDQHLKEKTEEIESRTRLDQIPLIVASRDLSRDTIIEEADYVVEQFPVKWAPDHALTVEQSDILVGKRLLTDLRAGQPFMQMHLQNLDATGVSNRLEPGLKAVSVTVDPSSAASGLIRAGDRVDLFVSLDHQGKRLTTVLLQSVEVLGTGHFSDLNTRLDDATSVSDANITLAVSHENAVRVIAAREAGSISAVLSSSQSLPVSQAGQSTAGDLAAILGLPTPSVSRMIPIMYGDRLSAESDEPASEQIAAGTR
ncbi:Flp pilus assembly protein CpaB [Zwartia sp.]|uniref:Flp pilus assembly protein CpaB n=1 Tax=Zwartia sp. TaxID=2978004 RepID=UPI003BB07A23